MHLVGTNKEFVFAPLLQGCNALLQLKKCTLSHTSQVFSVMSSVAYEPCLLINEGCDVLTMERGATLEAKVLIKQKRMALESISNKTRNFCPADNCKAENPKPMDVVQKKMGCSVVHHECHQAVIFFG